MGNDVGGIGEQPAQNTACGPSRTGISEDLGATIEGIPDGFCKKHGGTPVVATPDSVMATGAAPYVPRGVGTSLKRSTGARTPLDVPNSEKPNVL